MFVIELNFSISVRQIYQNASSKVYVDQQEQRNPQIIHAFSMTRRQAISMFKSLEVKSLSFIKWLPCYLLYGYSKMFYRYFKLCIIHLLNCIM